jgi:tRNA U38,U39,U40 pseudouridine synthase TruA
MSRTFLATLQFDGTGFVGWQRQPAGRSVQMEFERVLGRLSADLRWPTRPGAPMQEFMPPGSE